MIKDLEKAGVKRSNITLVCVNSIHRKFTRDKPAGIIGKDLVKEFGYTGWSAMMPKMLKIGFETTGSAEAAIERAQDYQNKDASMVFVKYPILACRQ